ncbi:MAG: DoxX family protein [Patescibacteria group bacterium]
MLEGVFYYGSFDLAMFIIRFVLGIVFIVHGFQKLQNIKGTIGMMSGMGFPMASVFVPILSLVEFVGGILVLIGLYTGWASLLLAIVMVGAILMVKMKKGFVNGWEFDLSLLAMALAVFFTGSGSWILF